MIKVTLPILAAVCVLLALGVCGCRDATFGNIYSTRQEEQMGAAAAAQINSSERMDTDPRDNSRVQQVAQAIFVQARKMRPGIPYQIRIIDSPEVNAFSLPGGYIYVYTGLLNKLGSDDDALACVIGHECAHVVLRHVVKQMSDSGIKGALVELLGVTTQNANLFNATDAVYQLEQLHFSREDEYQADKYGLMFAYNAGYDPYGMIRMFQKLENLEGAGGGGPAYAEDHPITRNRILRVEALIKVLRANDGTYPAGTDTVASTAAGSAGRVNSAPVSGPSLPGGMKDQTK